MPPPDPLQYQTQQAYQPRSSGPNFGTGLLSGALQHIQQTNAQEDYEVQEAKSRALEWLKSIPATERNLPITTKLALDVMSSKAPKRQFTDLFRQGQSTDRTHAFVDDIYSRLGKILPKQGPLEPEGVPEGMGADWQIRKPELAGGPPTPQPLTGMVRPPRPKLTQQPGTVEFPELGKFSPGPLFQDQQGQTFGSTFDTRKGTWQVSKPLGTGLVTEKERVAQIQATVKQQMANNAARKGLMAEVYKHAAADNVNPQQFDALSANDQARYYAKAGVMMEATDAAKALGVAAKTSKDVAETGFFNRMPVSPASTETGLTPAQTLADTRAREDDARKYANEFTQARARALAIKQQLDSLKASTPQYMQQGILGEEFNKKYGELTAQYQQALKLANDLADQAEVQHPGFLKGTQDKSGIPTINYTARTDRPTFQAKPQAQIRATIPASKIGMSPQELSGKIGMFANLPDPTTGKVRKGKIVAVNPTTGEVDVEWQR